MATVKEEPIEKLIMLTMSEFIDLKKPKMINLTYIETQVALLDNLWQYFVEPEEISFLTLSPVRNYLDTSIPGTIL